MRASEEESAKVSSEPSESLTVVAGRRLRSVSMRGDGESVSQVSSNAALHARGHGIGWDLSV